MKPKLLVVFSTIILFTSCELLQTSSLKKEIPPITIEVLNNQSVCIWDIPTQANECDIEYWLRFWSEIEDVSWPERKKLIDLLSEQDADVLKKILFSQGKSTPFQNRFRAQGWVESILPKLSPQTRRFILVTLYNPTQDFLEMESAIVSLSKINTHQFTAIEDQKIRLDKQQSQIDQLLNLEASMMQSIEEEKE